MRRPRLKAPAFLPVAYYHCVSRVVNREFVFGEEERDKLVEYMRLYERFGGPGDGWAWRREGSERVSRTAPTRREAIDDARPASRRDGVEMFIQSTARTAASATKTVTAAIRSHIQPRP